MAQQPPPGEEHHDHPLVVAARAGFGPLSDLSRSVWHGQSKPCASCGRLNRRDIAACAHCQQDLSQEMLDKMARHSGPWFVYDPVRPFPGVSLERIQRQIKRGVLTETSVVRGPTSCYQWRYAAETPLVASLLGRCWQCQAKLAGEQRICPACQAALDDPARPQSSEAAPPAANAPASEALAQLGEAVRQQAGTTGLAQPADNTSALGKALLIFVVIAAATLGLVIVFLSMDSERPAGPPAQPAEADPSAYYFTEPPVDDIT